MATANTLKTASVLSFERKLDPSDALLFSGAWKNRQSLTSWTPVVVREKSVRGTISNRLKTKDQDPAKLDAAIENPNLQTVDVATLPADADTLKVSFSLRVLSGAGTPNACNDAEYKTKLLATVCGYVEGVGFGELASRYAHNLANGRFLWRNRMGAEQVEVHIQHMVNGEAQKTWTFDALTLSMRSFEAGTAAASLKELSDVIAAGLSGKTHVLLQVTAFARLGPGQEVYPSQELILKKDKLNKEENKKSKTLYKVSGVAGIHSQKLGNAIRTIDTWHPAVAELGHIAVEPYGSITTLAMACRKPAERIDFYTLLDKWLLKDKAPALEQQHFVMATLIRGGVFGESGKD